MWLYVVRYTSSEVGTYHKVKMHPSSHIAQLSISSQSPAKWSGEVIANSSSGQTDSEVNFRPPQAQYFESVAYRSLATDIVIIPFE